MDAAKQQIVIQAINAKLGTRKLVCPISGDAAVWEVLEYSTSVPAIDIPGTLPMNLGPTLPLAVLMCKDCGYTMLINLIQLGIAKELDIPVSAND